MLPRPMREYDEEEWEAQKRYGKPQHEISRSTSEQELYGDPQHDVADEHSLRNSDFDLDLGYALDVTRFDFVQEVDSTEHQLLFAVER